MASLYCDKCKITKSGISVCNCKLLKFCPQCQNEMLQHGPICQKICDLEKDIQELEDKVDPE